MMGTAPSLDDLRAILRRHLSSDQVAVLFGSRAHGTATPQSDWDIGILGPEPLGGALLQRIRGDLEAMRTLHSFDLVDLALVTPAFRQKVLRDGVPLG